MFTGVVSLTIISRLIGCRTPYPPPKDEDIRRVALLLSDSVATGKPATSRVKHTGVCASVVIRRQRSRAFRADY